MLISFSSFIIGFLSMSETRRKTTIPNQILSLLTGTSGVTAFVSEVPGCLPLHLSCYWLGVSAVYYDHLKEKRNKTLLYDQNNIVKTVLHTRQKDLTSLSVLVLN